MLTTKKELGDYLDPKNPTTKKFTLYLASNCYNKTNRGKSKKPSQSIWAKKKEKGYQQYGILLFTMLKTLDSFLYWNPNLTKTQPWSRNLRTVMRCMT